MTACDDAIHTDIPEPAPYPGTEGIEVREIPDRRRDDALRELVEVGHCMATRLTVCARERVRHTGVEGAGAVERALAAAWLAQVAALHEAARRAIGYCEGLCGGLHSHDLWDGLCPQCRQDPRIQRAPR